MSARGTVGSVSHAGAVPFTGAEEAADPLA
jgi:hypothetical protein